MWLQQPLILSRKASIISWERYSYLTDWQLAAPLTTSSSSRLISLILTPFQTYHPDQTSRTRFTWAFASEVCTNLQNPYAVVIDLWVFYRWRLYMIISSSRNSIEQYCCLPFRHPLDMSLNTTSVIKGVCCAQTNITIFLDTFCPSSSLINYLGS